MAHELELKVIAEAIETQEQLDLLARAKYDFGQEFLFPKAPEQMEELLQENEKRYLLLAR
jgi:EAL domain-containing protein (putative c-di-GMP-specific phosphodiesterase class I)